MTNSFDMTDSIYGTSCAMYLALARLNHSCTASTILSRLILLMLSLMFALSGTPNAQQTHLPLTTEEVLYASRAIRRGEEINDCYIDLRQNRADRRKELLEYFRFHCECSGCHLHCAECVDVDSSTDVLSNHVECPHVIALFSRDDCHRRECDQYNDTLCSILHEQDIQTAIAYSLQIVSTLESNHCIQWSQRYLPEIYHSLFSLYSSVNQHKPARKYLIKAYKLSVLSEGENSPETLKLVETIKSLAKK